MKKEILSAVYVALICSILFTNLKPVSGCDTCHDDHSHGRFNLPSKVKENIRRMVEDAIGAGHSKKWMDSLMDNLGAMDDILADDVRVTMFLPLDDPYAVARFWKTDHDTILHHFVPHHAYSFSRLKSFKVGRRIPTFVSDKDIVITANSDDNFTINNVSITHSDIFQNEKIAVHGVRGLLKCDEPLPPSPHGPPPFSPTAPPSQPPFPRAPPASPPHSPTLPPSQPPSHHMPPASPPHSSSVPPSQPPSPRAPPASPPHSPSVPPSQPPSHHMPPVSPPHSPSVPPSQPPPPRAPPASPPHIPLVPPSQPPSHHMPPASPAHSPSMPPSQPPSSRASPALPPHGPSVPPSQPPSPRAPPALPPHSPSVPPSHPPSPHVPPASPPHSPPAPVAPRPGRPFIHDRDDWISSDARHLSSKFAIALSIICPIIIGFLM